MTAGWFVGVYVTAWAATYRPGLQVVQSVSRPVPSFATMAAGDSCICAAIRLASSRSANALSELAVIVNKGIGYRPMAITSANTPLMANVSRSVRSRNVARGDGAGDAWSTAGMPVLAKPVRRDALARRLQQVLTALQTHYQQGQP